MSASRASPITRLPQLDLLRFAAAFAVTLYHYVSSFPTAAELAGTALAPVAAVTRYGYLGVDLFFIISGFVILWSSLNRSPLEFALSRAGRLYPSFWVGLALACILISSSSAALPSLHFAPIDLRTLLANLTMVPGLLKSQPVDGVYWTLEMEIRFYALIFILLLFRQMRRIELWLYAWLVVAIVGLYVQMPWIVKFLLVQPYGPLFVTGCLCYRILAEGMRIDRGIGVAVAGVASMVLTVRQRGNFITPDALSAWIVPAVVGAFVVLFLLISLSRRTWAHSALVYRLGTLTYPLYLVHGIGGKILFEALRPWFGLTARVAIITAAALIVSWVMAVTVETHGRRLFERALRKLVGVFVRTQTRTVPVGENPT